jgi:hypothetical protein
VSPRPTNLDQIKAIFYDALGLPKPAGMMTLQEWERQVCLYRFEQLIQYMAEAIDERKDT